jgi:hypothetical protein
MTLRQYSAKARQARALMPKLSAAAAYVQMDQLMGRTEILSEETYEDRVRRLVPWAGISRCLPAL